MHARTHDGQNVITKNFNVNVDADPDSDPDVNAGDSAIALPGQEMCPQYTDAPALGTSIKLCQISLYQCGGIRVLWTNF